MKTALPIVLVVALGATAFLYFAKSANGSSGSAAAGLSTPAPEFRLQTHDGKTLELSALRGKSGAVLVFFATWCPGCMEEVPHIKRFADLARERGVLVYGVNLKQTQDVIDAFVREYAVNYRILLDRDATVTRDYAVTGIPLIVGIDAEGLIRYRDHALPADEEALLRSLAPAGTAAAPEKKPGAERIVDARTLRRWQEEGAAGRKVTVIDVLPAESFAQSHLPGAISLPLASLAEKASALPADARLVTYCSGPDCRASARAAEILSAKGFADVWHFPGGLEKWREAGLPIEGAAP